MTKTLGLSDIDEEEKKRRTRRFEILVAILLSVTALTTAWASWVGDLHTSEMSSNYAKAERQTSEANAAYSIADQHWVSAYDAWNYAYEMNEEIKYESSQGNTELAAQKQKLLDNYLKVNCEDFEYFADAIYDSLEKDDGSTPFDEYDRDKFFEEADKLSEEASDTRSQGDWNNLCADCFGLVRVLYSIVLFLLGIVGIYREPVARNIIFVASLVLFVGASIYMCTLPLPVTFSFQSFFSVIQS